MSSFGAGQLAGIVVLVAVVIGLGWELHQRRGDR